MTLLDIAGLTVRFPVAGTGYLRRSQRFVHALSEVDLQVSKGSTLGLVGESGSGKSTLARTLLMLNRPSSGSVTYDGIDVLHPYRSQVQQLRRRIQMVFQDPGGSLNPRMTVRKILEEPLRTHGARDRQSHRARVGELLDMVGISQSHLDSLPRELSGGQCQRIAIARALAVEPELLVMDEALSALDVSTQSELLDLLRQLRSEMNLSILFISHDLGVVRDFCDAVSVMYLGRLMEVGPAREMFDHPRHPYTQALLSASPVPDPRIERTRRRVVLQGGIPSVLSPPEGCPFHPRCPIATDQCLEVRPSLAATSSGDQDAQAGPDDHRAACHYDDADILQASEVRATDTGRAGSTIARQK